jgi:hypothetical protein
MGIRGEVFSTKVVLANRTYFFNVKENRLGDLFLNIVESKPNEGEGFERHQIVLFADDMKDFLKGLDDSLRFMEKEISGKRKKYYAATKAARAEAGEGTDKPKKRVLRKSKPAEGEHKPRPDSGRGEHTPRLGSDRGEFRPRKSEGQAGREGSFRHGSRPGKPAYQGGTGQRRQSETGSRYPGAPGYRKPAPGADRGGSGYRKAGQAQEHGGPDRGGPDYGKAQKAFHKDESITIKPRKVRAVKPKKEEE